MKNSFRQTKAYSVLVSLSIGICFISLSSFGLFQVAGECIGYESNAKTDGKIQFVGEVNTQQTFTIDEVVFVKFDMPEGNIEKVKAELSLNLTTFTSPWKELEENVKSKKSYFYIKKFPKASIKIEGAKKLESGEYQTDALLTLKGIEKAVKITFAPSKENPKKITGNGVVRRSEFSFDGDGPKEEVPITFEVTLPDTPIN